MFEIQIWDNISIQSSNENFPLLALWKTGQWKSTSLEQIILELIKNKQSWFVLDPYWNLIKEIESLSLSASSKEHIKCFDLKAITEDDILGNIENNLILISWNKLEEGSHITRKQSIKVLNLLFKYSNKCNYFVIDEAFEYIDNKEIFDNYLKLINSPDANLILSDEWLLWLSATQRKEILSIINTFIIYKPRNIDAKWLCDYVWNWLDQKDMSAIKQYHFQILNNGKIEYSPSLWPLNQI